MQTPWYANGLHFTCTRCGNCCTGEPGFVWVDEGEIAAIAKKLDVSEEEVIGLYTKPLNGKRSLKEKLNGDCVLYQKGVGCTIYEERPKQCRTWPFWESTTRTEAEWQRTQRNCPGAGRGELIPVEEITKRIQVIRI